VRKALILLSTPILFWAHPACAWQYCSTYVEGDPETGEGAMLLDGVCPEEQDITVLAAGERRLREENGQSVTVIPEMHVEDLQATDLTRVLEQFPGVSVTRNGGLGSLTALHVRGAESDQLLVLVDGVRVADAAAPGGGYDFGNLLAGNVTRVELLRGSNSVVWGSRAMSGVLSVDLAAQDGLYGQAEYGARDRFAARARAGGSTGALTASFGFAHTDDGGFSAAAGGSEPDGFEQQEVAGAIELRAAPSLTLRARGRAARSRLDIDGFPAPDYLLADTLETQETDELSGHLSAELNIPALTLRAIYSGSDTDRAYFDPAFGTGATYRTSGRSDRAELRGEWQLSDPVGLLFGLEHEWQSFRAGEPLEPRENGSSKSAYALVEYSPEFRHGPLDIEELHFAAGLRVDDHEGFGSAVSLGVNGAADLGNGWHAKASYGEGFRAPSLFQLYSEYGNGQLGREHSRSYDIAIGQTGHGYLDLWLTVFQRDSRDLIGFDSCFGQSDGICTDRPFGTYDNIGKARARGIELEARGWLDDEFWMQGSYAYVEAQDRSRTSVNFGKELARRPRHMATLTLEWVPEDGGYRSGFSIGADLRLVSRSFEDAANLTQLDGFATLTLRTAYQVSEEIELFARVENAWDEQYQTAAGYGTAGRSVFGGVRAKL
jgi:vitamin B12 transporter